MPNGGFCVKTRGFLNAFWLKIIMAALMVLDHMYYYGIFRSDLLWGHYLARLVAPMFAYFMTEGMIHTRNRPRYIARLYGAGGAMLAVNAALYLITGEWIPMNIFLSLAVGASLIFLIDRFRSGQNRALCAIGCIVSLLFVQYCEGAHLVPLMAAIFYYLRFNMPLMCATYVLATGLPYLLPYFGGEQLNPQFYMVFAVIPILLYNGRRGPNNAFSKYFFYVFYPLHIWALFLIARYFI